MHYRSLSEEVKKARTSEALNNTNAKIKEAYQIQLKHLQKQMQALQIDLNELESSKKSLDDLVELKMSDFITIKTDDNG